MARRFAPLLLVLALGAVAAGCGGSAGPPEGIVDPGAAATPGLAVPDWFPSRFPPPPGGVVISVIDQPDTGDVRMGRSVTWRVDRSHDQVERDIDATLASLGWTPTTRLTGGGERDSRRTSIFVQNDAVEVIRIFSDANLAGVRVTVELPKR